MQEVLTRRGGTATWRELRGVVHSRAIAAAVADGSIVRTRSGRYAVATADAALVAADGVAGVVSHTSAALHHGWSIKAPAARPHVTVRPGRRLDAKARAGVTLHVRRLAVSEVEGRVTTPVRTVIDCCLDLPWADALAVADSSWRAGLLPREVQVAARALPPRQCRRVWKVVAAADRRAANPFESVLRSIATTVPGWSPVPQVSVTTRGRAGTATFRVDLADEELRIVLEADSFEFHGDRSMLDRDCRRYDRLVVDGWLVLRFSWEMVMGQPVLVRALIADAVERRRRDRSC